ncbi:MAG: sigma-54-dependent Fis family transcriptional regulator [Deltaproteobacteria bacterium]|nr:sigma-54-dependent Fis family transcriptional regulator [Deltaproteobacteria bacterium]
MIRVLIVDDEKQLVEAFKKQLTADGMEVITASCAKEALATIKKKTFDVGVLDIKLPDLNGVELLLKLKQLEPHLEVIMLTGFASVDTAIRSMKLGAYDYLTKPCKISELHKVITKAYEKKTLEEKTIVLKEHLHRLGPPDDFIGESKPIKEVKKLIAIVAASNVPALILGETGTGKELAARAIHNLSPRAGNPFVAINASALQETILESELFGYKKGAFTGAQDNKLGLLEIAHNGTLFVDEVGDMGQGIQAKLLRVLETGAFIKLGDTKETRVDVRFIFATNKELPQEVAAGRFRKDFFFRVNAFTIQLPPLRMKQEDIPLLADHFLEKFSRGGKKKRLAPGTLEVLAAYEWPGNVRELANVLERSMLLSGPRKEIRLEDFPEELLAGACQIKKGKKSKSSETVLNLTRLEEEYIEKVLSAVGGNKTKAARLLGITRATLYSKIR